MTIPRVIVTADDFGVSEGVNEGILVAYERGIVTRCSLLANGNAFDHAIGVALEKNKTLPVGVHLNIMFGKPLYMRRNEIVSDEGIMKISYWRLLKLFYFNTDKLLLDQVRDEFMSQVEKVVNAIGRPVSHLDSQAHIHNIPPIFDVVCQVAGKFGFPGIRSSKEVPTADLLLNGINLADIVRGSVLSTLASQCKKNNIDCPKRIFGIYQSGKVRPGSIRNFVSALPNIKSEICVHPGFPGLRRHETPYEQEWVNKWVSSKKRFLELKTVTAWTKPEFESEFKVKLCS